jgi:hypothetical protein
MAVAARRASGGYSRAIRSTTARRSVVESDVHHRISAVVRPQPRQTPSSSGAQRPTRGLSTVEANDRSRGDTSVDRGGGAEHGR